ncbi:MAG: hypothetical protein EA399_04615 [Desulfovibrionales bacterium]|nr:MAG: hypothetical protein EA399_04615 [Desulfovibrionales bacterium]
MLELQTAAQASRGEAVKALSVVSKGADAILSFMSFVQKVILHKAVVSDQWLVVRKINMLPEYRKVLGAAPGLFAVASFIRARGGVILMIP